MGPAPGRKGNVASCARKFDLTLHLSTRNRYQSPQLVRTPHVAFILDGARRLESTVATAEQSAASVLVLGVVGLTPEEELSARTTLFAEAANGFPISLRNGVSSRPFGYTRCRD